MILKNNPKLIKFCLKRLIEIITNYRVRYHIPPREGKKILFTFDDGPLPNTLNILNLLDEMNVKAVFFLIAENIKKYPGITKEIVNRGHLIGLHGFNHINMKELSLFEFSHQIKNSSVIIENICGVKIRYFRPPFGQINFIQMVRLLINGFTVFFWSCGVSEAGKLDFINPQKKNSFKNLIVLLHDYNSLDIIGKNIKILNKL